MNDDVATLLTEARGPSWAKREPPIIGNGAASADEDALRRATTDSIRALQLIRAYRVRGHLEADLAPLGLEKRGPYPELDFRSYGFTESDLDREIFIADLFSRERASLREIIAILRETFQCGRRGATLRKGRSMMGQARQCTCAEGQRTGRSIDRSEPCHGWLLMRATHSLARRAAWRRSERRRRRPQRRRPRARPSAEKRRRSPAPPYSLRLRITSTTASKGPAQVEQRTARCARFRLAGSG